MLTPFLFHLFLFASIQIPQVACQLALTVWDQTIQNITLPVTDSAYTGKSFDFVTMLQNPPADCNLGYFGSNSANLLIPQSNLTNGVYLYAANDLSADKISGVTCSFVLKYCIPTGNSATCPTDSSSVTLTVTRNYYFSISINPTSLTIPVPVSSSDYVPIQTANFNITNLRASSLNWQNHDIQISPNLPSGVALYYCSSPTAGSCATDKYVALNSPFVFTLGWVNLHSLFLKSSSGSSNTAITYTATIPTPTGITTLSSYISLIYLSGFTIPSVYVGYNPPAQVCTGSGYDGAGKSLALSLVEQSFYKTSPLRPLCFTTTSLAVGTTLFGDNVATYPANAFTVVSNSVISNFAISTFVDLSVSPIKSFNVTQFGATFISGAVYINTTQLVTITTPPLTIPSAITALKSGVTVSYLLANSTTNTFQNLSIASVVLRSSSLAIQMKVSATGLYVFELGGTTNQLKTISYGSQLTLTSTSTTFTFSDIVLSLTGSSSSNLALSVNDGTVTSTTPYPTFGQDGYIPVKYFNVIFSTSASIYQMSFDYNFKNDGTSLPSLITSYTNLVWGIWIYNDGKTIDYPLGGYWKFMGSNSTVNTVLQNVTLSIDSTFIQAQTSTINNAFPNITLAVFYSTNSGSGYASHAWKPSASLCFFLIPAIFTLGWF